MRILIVEDDFASRRFLYKVLAEYGQCDTVVDGLEALDAVFISMRDHKSYDLICLDIMMPKVDGVKILKAIRDLEKKKGLLPHKRAKVILTTALEESQLVKNAFEEGCEGCLIKPIDTDKLIEMIKNLGLI